MLESPSSVPLPLPASGNPFGHPERRIMPTIIKTIVNLKEWFFFIFSVLVIKKSEFSALPLTLSTPLLLS
jgi:hypothetical protein